MGACSFYEVANAATAEDAFQELRREAVCEYGNDAYNGTISTCHGFRMAETFSEYKETKKRQAEINGLEEWILENTAKRECRCIDLGVIGYERTVMKETSRKSDAVFRQKYALEVYRNFEWVETYSSDSKTTLKEKAKAYALNDEKVRIVRKPVLIEGDCTVNEFSVEKEFFKRKPKKINGTVAIREIHKYVFIGWAAE